jgi:cytochrome P450
MEAATTTVPRPAHRALERRLPPSPPLPKPVQTAIWSRQARRLLYACQDRYGDMFTIRVAYEGTWVMLADPEAIKQVFTGDPKVFHAGEGNQILATVLGQNSLLVLDEKPHMSQRKLLLPPFHGARMQGYERTMSEIAEREIAGWPTGTPYKLRPRMQAVTLEIILQTVFGVREGERMAELRGALRDFLDLTTNPRALLPLLLVGPDRVRKFGPFRRRIERVDGLIYREIAERRRAGDVGERDDVLSMLVGARHEDAGSAEGTSEISGGDERERAKRESGQPMSDEEIRDELLTLLVAGHETTATSLAWAVERLARHPEKLERLRAEVAEGREEYLTATIQETLRLRPVISIVLRKLTEPVEIGGYELPAGVSVAPCVYLVHRNPEIYPEPMRFLPERFLENPPGTYTWIPFGGGVRRCLGASFAQFEMAVVLRELVRRHQIRPAKPKPERVFRRAITETPRHDAEVVLS